MSYAELMQSAAKFAVETADSEEIECQSVVHTTRLPWRKVRAQVQRGHETGDLVPGHLGHSGEPSVRVFVSKADVPAVRTDQDRVRIGKEDYRVMEVLHSNFGGWEIYCAR